MDSVRDDPEGPGFPIRKSTDQRLLAAPRGLSQRATSFIASWRQGIHQMPLRRLLEHPVTHSGKNRHPISGTFNALMLDRSAAEPATTGKPRQRSVLSFIHNVNDRMTDDRGQKTDKACFCLPSSVFRPPPAGWWSRPGSNRRPPACKAGALPTELRSLNGGPGLSGGPG